MFIYLIVASPAFFKAFYNHLSDCKKIVRIPL